jgi:predicted metal-dependent phosphoesterase TrpH
MNLETRKIEFVQEFLNIQSEEIVSRLEKILRKEKKVSTNQAFTPMSKNDLNKRIDKSESDFQNNRFKKSSEILAKYN